MSKRNELAMLCREQHDQALKASVELSPLNMEFPRRVLAKSGTLLGVLALLLDDQPAPSNGRVLYERKGRAFVKVKP